ncbi:MAG: toll/interleukin-1 receptor domain-containing protein [Hyphomonadaceae bacterium]|nr:toll/interleukin-1 receptor domain-containing protein [Hyphomonadaceae bacterium]
MSNGYVLAAKADMAVGQEIAQGFGLELIALTTITEMETATLVGAANLGLILSQAAARDAGYTTILRVLAARAPRAQLIAVEADARASFPFLPAGWALMTLDEARNRLAEMARRRAQAEAPPPAPEPAPPEPVAAPPEPIAIIEPPPPEPRNEEIAAELAVEEAPEDEGDDAPTPEQVRDYVRAELRAFYDDKTQLAPIIAAVDAEGVAAFAAAVLAAPEDEEASPAANVLRALMRLALAALHARGVNLGTAGFGAVADEATRLADAVDIDALADMMRYASEREEDPMQLVRNAAERLREEAAVSAETPEPQSEAEPEPEAPAEPDALDSMDEELASLSDDDAESPAPVMPAPAPSMPPAPEPPLSNQPQAPSNSWAKDVLGGDDQRAAQRRDQFQEAEDAFKQREDELRRRLAEAHRTTPLPADVLESIRKHGTGEREVSAKAIVQAAQGDRKSESRNEVRHDASYNGSAVTSSGSAPADASAFAPKKLRRGEAELVQVVIHQPKDLRAVIKAARKADERTDPAPTGMRIGDIALGETVGVALEVRGAACNGEVQRRTWTGSPLTFAFTAEAEADAKQVVFIARVFVGDAEIGVIAFTRGVSGPKKKPENVGDALRMKRHKRVFISYSSKDRETVAAIATAYAAAGVEHFFDRTSLASGEEWSPRLRKEIDRADLFHLCWSKSAAQSEWVEKEATHALTRRQRSKGKAPAITVQMLDGPPWAPHPPHLDSINFDDFVRAAIVGYARGDGE